MVIKDEARARSMFVVVCGGVMSGIGKGVVTASIARILRDVLEMRISVIKIDPYLNASASHLSPYEHGEVFVTADGAEVDLDAGTYERFLDTEMHAHNFISSGRVYHNVTQRERSGQDPAYLGRTIQIVPHVRDEIIHLIDDAMKKDAAAEGGVAIIELGGTVGDMEALPFLEALRLLQQRRRGLVVLVTHVPQSGGGGGGGGEHKTRPSQQAIRELRSHGITPNLVICRCGNSELAESPLRKLNNALGDGGGGGGGGGVFSCRDVEHVEQIPMLLVEQGMLVQLTEVFRRDAYVRSESLNRLAWIPPSASSSRRRLPITIALVGKYTGEPETYQSVAAALAHATSALDMPATSVRLRYVNADTLDSADRVAAELRDVAGVLLPGGFGARSVENMILVAAHCRRTRLPFLGLCLGFQVATIEYWRNARGQADVNSAEFDPGARHAFRRMERMRTGDRVVRLRPGSAVAAAYGFDDEAGDGGGGHSITERFRHRYVLSSEFMTDDAEMSIQEDVLERTGGGFYVGVQFHPEFRSRATRPAPLFVAFLLRVASR